MHLDTDLGGDPDDAFALALLLAWPGVELVGITTNLDVGGERAGCVRRVLQLAGRDDVSQTPRLVTGTEPRGHFVELACNLEGRADERGTHLDVASDLGRRSQTANEVELAATYRMALRPPSRRCDVNIRTQAGVRLLPRMTSPRTVRQRPGLVRRHDVSQRHR
ncbi:MAG: hypothetical protein H0U21_10515 [Acidimicrobiia bacterium]|nr:hypothetical protein [Acidimicrobiia bacterium]